MFVVVTVSFTVVAAVVDGSDVDGIILTGVCMVNGNFTQLPPPVTPVVSS